MQKTLLIKDFMIGHPYTVQYDESASAAEKVMASHRIRHLPVLDGKKIMGIVSDREIALGRTLYKDRAFDGQVQVKEVCLFNDCVVDSTDTLEKVAAKMSKLKLDAVVVVEGRSPIGIFTSTDACRLLSDLCKNKQPSRGLWKSLFDW